MSKKQTILVIAILAAAFMAGWAIYTRFIPSESPKDTEQFPTEENVKISTSSNTQKGPGFRQMVRTLDLSEEQTKQFSDIEGEYRNEVSEYMQQLDTIDLMILEEIKKENPDQQKLDSLAARTGAMQHALKKATNNHFLQIKRLCTPVQREKFNNVLSDIDRFRRGQKQRPSRGQGRHQGRSRRWNNQ